MIPESNYERLNGGISAKLGLRQKKMSMGHVSERVGGGGERRAVSKRERRTGRFGAGGVQLNFDARLKKVEKELASNCK